MSKPGWSDPSANPFALFGAAAGSGATAQPLAQGLAGGMDLFKKFWSNLPGGTAIPGFLVPTLDVGELDKRLSDLRAAEQWLEANLTVLRATIQGLEVQRNTIAAIQSLSAMRDTTSPASAPASSGLPAGWPMSPPSAPAPAPSPEPATAAPIAAEAVGSPAPKEAGDGVNDTAAGGAADAPPAPPALAGLAASNWLGFMQDQFAKVAQAALTPSTPNAAGSPVPAPPTARKTARKAVAKKAARRKAAPRKSA